MKIKNLHVPLFITIVLATAFALPAVHGLGNPEKETKTVSYTGLVQVVGNEPFTKVVIQLTDGIVYNIDKESLAKLRGLTGKQIRFSYRSLETKTPILANGKKLRDEYWISGLVILEIIES